MSEEATEVDLVEDRKAWLRKLADEFVKLEPLFPMPTVLPDEGGPQWVQNVERQLGAVMLPIAKIKDDSSLTPRRMGALIGHSCAYGVWMLEDFVAKTKTPKVSIDAAQVTAKQLEGGKRFISGVATVWYPALRRLAKRALCSSVDQPFEDMTEFLLAYSQAFSRKPKTAGMGEIGNPATVIYVYLIYFWRDVDAMASVRQLHQRLVSVFGSRRIGNLKRIEKICQRIDLHFRKPGPAKKVKTIPTPD